MKLKELQNLVASDDQTIVLINSHEIAGKSWLGSFPNWGIPQEYLVYEVESIMPDYFNGEGFESGCVLKVWIKEN